MPGTRTGVITPASALKARSFGDEDFCDVIIKCGSSTWKVHRLVVCKQSQYLKSLWRDAPADETGEYKVIELPHTGPSKFDAPTMHKILQFMYTKEYDYPVVSVSSEETNASAQQNGRSHNDSNSYNDMPAPTLTKIEIADGNKEPDELVVAPSNHPLPSDIVACLKVHARVSEQADLLRFESMKIEALSRYAMGMPSAWSHPEFSGLLKLTYSLPASDIPGGSIRSQAAALCADHIEFLMNCGEFKETIIAIPSLGWDILKADIEAKKGSREDQSELEKPREVDEKLEEAEAIALQRLQEGQTAEKKRFEEETNLLTIKVHNLEQKQKEWAQLAERLFDLTHSGVFQKIPMELTSLEKGKDVRVQDVWAVLSSLVDELTQVNSKLQEIIKSSRENQFKARQETEAALRKVDDLKGYFELKELELRAEARQTAKDISKRYRDEIVKLTVSFKLEKKELQEEIERQKSKLKAFADETSLWKLCRHCKQKFNGYLAMETCAEDKYSWRCSECDTRHGQLKNL